jgi:hypothetical protein
MFDIKLKEEEAPVNFLQSEIKTDSHIASFEPDIGSLVTFTGGRKEYMRNKTQLLIR